MRHFSPILICILAFSPLHAAVIVQLRVLEGDGAVYPVNSRATRGLTVQVTDESGQPVNGATVSFRLPDQGAGGTFSTGLRTEVVTTQVDGRATVWGMQWNKTPGQFDIRITAVREQARAGIMSTQYLSDATAEKVAGNTASKFQASHHGRNRWLMIGAIAAGAGVGLAFAAGQAKSTPSVSPVVPTVIGSPSIIIGPK